MKLLEEKKKLMKDSQTKDIDKIAKNFVEARIKSPFYC